MPDPHRPLPLATRADAARKPLLGFGWIGCLLLPILVALIIVVAAGYDLRYQIQKLVLDTFGLDALFDFTIYIILGTGMGAGSWPPSPRFGPVTLCIVLLALHIHPRRVGIAPCIALWILGLLSPALLTWMCWAPLRALGRSGGPSWELANSLSLALAFLALLWATHSWRLSALASACLAVPVAGLWAVFLDPASSLPALLTHAVRNEAGFIGASVHLALAAILLTWAIRARLHALPDHACPACAYDLRGTPAGPCPECGLHTPPPRVDLPVDQPIAQAPTPKAASTNGAARDQEHDRIR